MTDPKELQAVMVAAAPGMELAFKPMFGGIMGYVGGKVFASLSDVGLALKLAGAAHAELLAVPGAARLRYEAGAPESKSYVVVPGEMLGQAAVLRGWMERSAREAPVGKRKPNR